MTSAADRQASATSLRRMLIPLALAQFICSFAGSNMNVMINDIKDRPVPQPHLEPGLIGLVATLLLPRGEPSPGADAAGSIVEQPG